MVQEYSETAAINQHWTVSHFVQLVTVNNTLTGEVDRLRQYLMLMGLKEAYDSWAEKQRSLYIEGVTK